MADERRTATTTTAAADGERPPPDDERRVTASGSGGVALDRAPPAAPGVAFVDMPAAVREISADPDHADGDDDNNETEDDEETAAENDDELPYPEYNEKAFYYFLQTTRPRNWCLQLITWPYPFCTCSRLHSSNREAI